MASLIKQGIEDILTALTNSGEFNYIAIWNDHANRLVDGSGYSFNAPGAFVELEPTQTLNLSAGITQTDYIIRIHIVHVELDSIDGSLDQNLNVFDYRDAVKKYLTGIKPTNFGNLMYNQEYQDYEHTNVYHYIIEFKAGFVDTKGSPYDADSTDWIETTPPTALNLTATYNPDPYLKNK